MLKVLSGRGLNGCGFLISKMAFFGTTNIAPYHHQSSLALNLFLASKHLNSW